MARRDRPQPAKADLGRVESGDLGADPAQRGQIEGEEPQPLVVTDHPVGQVGREARHVPGLQAIVLVQVGDLDVAAEHPHHHQPVGEPVEGHVGAAAVVEVAHRDPVQFDSAGFEPELAQVGRPRRSVFGEPGTHYLVGVVEIAGADPEAARRRRHLLTRHGGPSIDFSLDAPGGLSRVLPEVSASPPWPDAPANERVGTIHATG